MGWADHAIAKLSQGETVQIRPRGHSMSGKIEDNQLVTIQPCDPKELRIGDIVLVRVKGSVYLHLIKASRINSFLIGNNRGKINGWASHANIFGVVAKGNVAGAEKNKRLT